MTDQAQSVGQLLKQAREAKSWTVEEAVRRTKLKKDAIVKMEADQFELFPSLSNARGFVRIYARELGLNGWHLMQHFEDAPDVPVEGLDLHPEDLEAIPRRKQPPLATSQGIGLFVIFLVLAIACVLVGIRIYQIIPSGERDGGVTEVVPEDPPEEGNPAQAEPITAKAVPVGSDPATPTPKPVVVQPATPAAVPAAQPAAVANQTGNKLRLQANPNAPAPARFVRVTATRGSDDVVLYEGVLPAGQTLPSANMPAWQGDRFTVLFRETSAVEIIFNDTNFGTYDQSGVQTVVLPAP